MNDSQIRWRDEQVRIKEQAVTRAFNDYRAQIGEHGTRTPEQQLKFELYRERALREQAELDLLKANIELGIV